MDHSNLPTKYAQGASVVLILCLDKKFMSQDVARKLMKTQKLS